MTAEYMAVGEQAVGSAHLEPVAMATTVRVADGDTRSRCRRTSCTELAVLTRSPVVELNRAVAIAETGAVEEALALLDALDLDGYRYLHSTRAELLRRLGRDEEARAAYRRALELGGSEPSAASSNAA